MIRIVTALCLLFATAPAVSAQGTPRAARSEAEPPHPQRRFAACDLSPQTGGEVGLSGYFAFTNTPQSPTSPPVWGERSPKEPRSEAGEGVFVASQIDFAAIETVAKKELADGNIPGAVVVIVQANQVVYAKGFGVTSVEGTESLTPEHLFRAGSTTKVFVGMAAGQLAEAGKLKLNEPVGELIELSPPVERLTVHQLLTHTAGVSDQAVWFGRHDDEALLEGVKTWRAERAFTKPGEVYSYSSPGYWLAGAAIEVAAKKPFADALAEGLFAPLGMKRTTFRPTLAMTYPLAQGHEIREGKPSIIRPAADNSATWPGGSMFTSGNDMSRFVIAFLNGGKLDGKQVLSASLLKTVASPHVKVPGRGHYGYGVHVERFRGVDIVTHNGVRPGYGSRFAMAPEQKFGLVILANRTGASLPKTAEKILELALPLEPIAKQTEEPKPTAEELAKLAGAYRNGATTLELGYADGKLTLTEAKRSVTVEPLGGSRFGVAGMEGFESITGADGKTTYLFRSGRAFKKQ